MRWPEKDAVRDGVMEMLKVNMGLRAGESLLVVSDLPDVSAWARGGTLNTRCFPFGTRPCFLTQKVPKRKCFPHRHLRPDTTRQSPFPRGVSASLQSMVLGKTLKKPPIPCETSWKNVALSCSQLLLSLPCSRSAKHD